MLLCCCRRAEVFVQLANLLNQDFAAEEGAAIAIEVRSLSAAVAKAGESMQSQL